MNQDIQEKVKPTIQIKGIKEGLLIILSEGDWVEVQQALLEQLDQKSEFIRGARIALDVGNHVLKAVDLGRLRDELSGRGITLWSVMSTSGITEATAQTLGMATRITKPGPDRAAHKAEGQAHPGEEALMLAKTLRSGFCLKYAGHVVVIGDVNPGAEIVASGNVVVWGRLRGLVHAGAEGDGEAMVCALDLAPTQLRIADQIALTPQRRGKPQPEMAHLKDGKVVAEPWNPKG